MFDLDMEFSKIIHKYLAVEYKENKRDLIYGKVYKILQSKCLKKNIAMWGVGDVNNPEETYVSKFLNVFADSLQNTKCLVDMRRELEGKELLGLPIVLPDKMFKYNVDVILVTSYRSRKYIVKEIKARYPNIPYLDIYEELEKMGFYVDVDIFVEDDKYIDLYYQKENYLNATNINDQEEEFQKLLIMYANIKDIYYICKCINECEISDYSFISKMNKLREELIQLMEKTRETIVHRKDVVVWFQDGFRNIDWYDSEKKEFRVLKNISDKSICMVNSYSTAPTTYESVYSIITGNLPFEGKVYDTKFSFNIEQFAFLQRALEKDYYIKYYTDEAFDFLNSNRRLGTYHKKYMPEIIWEILKQMCIDDKNTTLHFAYAMKELHVPFLCGWFSQKPIRTFFSKMGLEGEKDNWHDVKAQFEDCLKYFDEELENFFSMLGKDTVIVLFSDHAHVVYDEYESKPFYLYYDNLEKSVKNVFMIYKKTWEHKIYDKLVSMIDFNDIAMEIFSHKIFELPYRKNIKYQYYPIQNIAIRQNAKYFSGQDYINGIECCYDGNEIEVKTPSKKEYIRKDCI